MALRLSTLMGIPGLEKARRYPAPLHHRPDAQYRHIQ